MRGLRRLCVCVGVLLVMLLTTAGGMRARADTAGYDWLQFNGDAAHGGDNTAETTISAGNVGSLQRIFQVKLPDIADGSPVYLRDVATATGTHDLVFVTTEDGHIVALDAQTGAQAWASQVGPGTCHVINDPKNPPCWTTASPAIDPNRQWVYSYGLDGAVHKYAVGDGSETIGGGWPELVTRKGFDEKESPALSLVTAKDGTHYLYASTSGYPGPPGSVRDPGDAGDYQGHITTINLETGTQHVFNTVCSDQADVHFVAKPGTPDCPDVQAAAWGRSGVVYLADTDTIFTSTGNGDFAPAQHDWGDSLLALHPDGTGINGGPLDSYTPADFTHLQDDDQDIGSTSPVILPVPAASRYPHLALQSGKDSLLRLIDLDDLSGQGGPGHAGGEVSPPALLPQGGEVLTQPATWLNPRDGSTWVFIANTKGESALQLIFDANGLPSLRTVWHTNIAGASPLVAHGVLYDAVNGSIQARDPYTARLLWADPHIGPNHWESPMVANGRLYITDENGMLTAYALSYLQATLTSATDQSIGLSSPVFDAQLTLHNQTGAVIPAGTPVSFQFKRLAFDPATATLSGATWTRLTTNQGTARLTNDLPVGASISLALHIPLANGPRDRGKAIFVKALVTLPSHTYSSNSLTPLFADQNGASGSAGLIQNVQVAPANLRAGRGVRVSGAFFGNNEPVVATISLPAIPPQVIRASRIGVRVWTIHALPTGTYTITLTGQWSGVVGSVTITVQ